MRSSKSIQSEIKALLKQKADREADLKKHQLKKCSCVGKSPLRCQGMQDAAKSIVSNLRAKIYHLRQLELKAITQEKAHETAFQIPGRDDVLSSNRSEVSGRNSPRRRKSPRNSSQAGNA